MILSVWGFRASEEKTHLNGLLRNSSHEVEILEKQLQEKKRSFTLNIINCSQSVLDQTSSQIPTKSTLLTDQWANVECWWRVNVHVSENQLFLGETETIHLQTKFWIIWVRNNTKHQAKEELTWKLFNGRTTDDNLSNNTPRAPTSAAAGMNPDTQQVLYNSKTRCTVIFK